MLKILTSIVLAIGCCASIFAYFNGMTFIRLAYG